MSEPRRAPEADSRAAPPPAAEADGAGDRPVPTGPRQPPGEINGPRGPEPTRYGDWEKGGRCTDF